MMKILFLLFISNLAWAQTADQLILFQTPNPDKMTPKQLQRNSEVYLEKAFLNTDYFPKERLPNAKKLGETSLMFLIHPTLTEDELDKTCEALTSVMEKACN